MKLDFKKSTLIKMGIIVAILVVSPFLVPFALEFVILADVVGLEALIVFLFVYAKSIVNTVRIKLDEMGEHIAHTARLVAELYMFKPRIYIGHATASSLVIVLASSVMLACVVWLPVMLASTELLNIWM